MLGPNGSGKSTLIRCLVGDFQGRREGIAVRWGGEIAWFVEATHDLARVVAYLPQSPVYHESQSVAGSFAAGPRAPYWGAFGLLESQRDLRIATEVARRLGLSLSELLGRRMDELSGGQRQRSFSAGAVPGAGAAGVLLLDEPGTFLDLRYQVELYGMLRGTLAHGTAGWRC